ncbi:MAG: hypothetical protein ACRD0P_15065 [Stackebrandtia sp.]
MNRHGADTLSLTAGLVFVALGAIWLVDYIATLTPKTVVMCLAGVLALVLVIGVVRLISRPRSSKTDTS